MTPDLYCVDKATPPGSLLHYCLLSTEPDTRAALSALWALEREIGDVPRECREAAVAQAKLDWWREEIERLYADAPRHPVTQALAPHLARRPLARDAFVELIDGVAMPLEYDIYPSLAQLTPYCHRTGSTPTQLASELLGYQDRAVLRFAHELGMALALLHNLREVRADALRGRCFIPEDELQRHGVAFEALQGTDTTPAVQALFGQQLARIRETLARALSLLPQTEITSQRPLVVRARLTGALIDEMEADGLRLLEYRIELTPLRTLWLAWSAHRRARRQRL